MAWLITPSLALPTELELRGDVETQAVCCIRDPSGCVCWSLGPEGGFCDYC